MPRRLMDKKAKAYNSMDSEEDREAEKTERQRLNKHVATRLNHQKGSYSQIVSSRDDDMESLKVLKRMQLDTVTLNNES